MSDWKNIQYKNGKMRTSESGGGGTVTDVTVDGTSVVNQQGVAEIEIPSVPDKLSDLSDINLSNIQDGQIIKWDATNNKWINANESGGGGVALPEYIAKRSEYSGTRSFIESMKYLGIASGSAAFSVEAYFYASENYSGHIVSFGSQSTHQAFGMALNEVVTWGDDWSIGGSSHVGTHHRIITYDGNATVKTYEDNVLINTHVLSGSLNIGDSNVYWGLWIQNSWNFRGNIYYCKYYNRALTADEVSLLYANRKNQF